ncbi:MAG: TrmH family RNA methyltransferase [Flavobacteriales bacterium]
MIDPPSLQEQIAFFLPYVSEHKRRLIERVLDERTRHMTVALEDIYQSQNASAVLRSCDCFGVQDVHIVEEANDYTLNKDVTLGSQKWIELYRYKRYEANREACIQALRHKGYRIVATTVQDPDHDPESLPIETPFCLFFGTEMEGLSDTVLQEADERLVIPMHGFTQSFNISASAAILLYRLGHRLRSTELEWGLSEAEKDKLRLKWYRKIRPKVRPPWERKDD